MDCVDPKETSRQLAGKETATGRSFRGWLNPKIAITFDEQGHKCLQSLLIST
jgi:hypothetical protein